MKKRTILILTSLIFLLGGGLASYSYFSDNSLGIDRTDSKIETVEQEVESANSQDEESGIIVESDQDHEDIDASITLTGVNVSSQGFEFGSIINGLENTEGTCVLTLSKEGQSSINRTSGITSQVDYHVCEGFTVPGQTLSASGAWQAQITFTSGNQTFESNVVEFEVSI